MRGLGPTSEKILLLLLGGVALGFSGSPTRYARVAQAIKKEWKAINRTSLYRSIRKLYESQLIKYVEEKDGSVQIVLSKAGHQMALRYKIDEMKILEPKVWDKKWRVILFDVPEEIKNLRDTLRTKLKQLGFIELQKSVFVHPFDCRNEVDFIIEIYNARQFVRFIEAVFIDNELHLRHKFGLR